MRWDFHNEAPIYAQVMERIERMIVSGALRPGQRLPSVRAFAMEAGINPNTMQKALTELERGGLIYNQRTAGHFVTNDSRIIAEVRKALADGQTLQYLQRMRELGFTPDQTEQLLRQLNKEGREDHGNSDL